ncbi:MAG: hypothetical protein KGL39_34715 [Patescibacteria group bacterium]|nr:hypothetical protein [Patescibacteria group bacterium]
MSTAYLNTLVLDDGLSYLTAHGTDLYICSALPASFTDASSTYALGKQAAPTISSPEAGVSTGRRVAVSAITAGSVTATGTASYWAIVDTTNSALLAAAPLSAAQGVTNGNTFSLTAFNITLPSPA